MMKLYWILEFSDAMVIIFVNIFSKGNIKDNQ